MYSIQNETESKTKLVTKQRWTLKSYLSLKRNDFKGQPCCYGNMIYYGDIFLSIVGLITLITLGFTYKDLIRLHQTRSISLFTFIIFVFIIPSDRLFGCIVSILYYRHHPRILFILFGVLLGSVNFLFLFLYPFQKSKDIRIRLISEIYSFVTAIIKIIITSDVLLRVPSRLKRPGQPPPPPNDNDYTATTLLLWFQVSLLCIVFIVRVTRVTRYLCTSKAFFQELEEEALRQ